MQGGFGYEFVSATPDDVVALRAQLREIRTTLTHPDGQGRRAGFRPAAERQELLLLLHEDPREHERRLDGFVEFHMRVDDVLVLRDAGSVGEAPHAAIIKHLIAELVRSLAPVGALVKMRRDATVWNDIVASVAGFELAGSEYRRPHWINVWEWSRERAARGARMAAPRRAGPRPGARGSR